MVASKTHKTSPPRLDASPFWKTSLKMPTLSTIPAARLEKLSDMFWEAKSFRSMMKLTPNSCLFMAPINSWPRRPTASTNGFSLAIQYNHKIINDFVKPIDNLCQLGGTSSQA